MKGFVKFILVAGILSASPAWAATGKNLVDWGKDYETNQAGTSFTGGSFFGYVSAVADSFRGVGLCPPDNVTYGQLAAITLKYLRNNPEQWNQDASGLVYESLSRTFPCKKK
ncbi:hypothetical protein FBY04_12035 [Pseudomonas sp. SJZ080]|uniref:Rap1a/Tai family immunity protein n=1 Tax=Pseudomonas sp. SJZ080 TaxID=2572888 RepID=UPI00119B1580|nr:Rap1a/Tai family immunity protein [Pseudomonas sp. SJZ080]TWC50142.1 hypothetical protein FBY04_12035 [Pseudomonas sp. SJZ080]